MASNFGGFSRFAVAMAFCRKPMAIPGPLFRMVHLLKGAVPEFALAILVPDSPKAGVRRRSRAAVYSPIDLAWGDLPGQELSLSRFEMAAPRASPRGSNPARWTGETERAGSSLCLVGSSQWGTDWSRDEHCARHVFCRPLAPHLLCNAGLYPIILFCLSRIWPGQFPHARRRTNITPHRGHQRQSQGQPNTKLIARIYGLEKSVIAAGAT